MDADACGVSGSDYQTCFHQRWSTLHDSHVRSLAWLLEAPDLLAPADPRWQQKIASLPKDAADHATAWLHALDAEPADLHRFLAIHPFTRLGRYAEKLMAWYFHHQGTLFAHGLQVQTGKNDTIGEFDFLLKQGNALLHWEFATKFYLLYPADREEDQLAQTDYFVGPNLADTLGAKMRKLLERQLSLGQHPAAQPHLPQALAAAQALIRGWLFYRRGDSLPSDALGISTQHCRGWWCNLHELDGHVGPQCVVLPRLSWLAPAKLRPDAAITRAALQRQLTQGFETDPMPVMVATVAERQGWLEETGRGFVVPCDWQDKAANYCSKSAKIYR